MTFTSDKIRSHNFRFYLKIPVIRNWLKRHEFLDRKGIDYRSHNWSHVYSQSFLFMDCTVILYNNGINVIFPMGFDFYSDSAKKGKKSAVDEFFKVVHGLEKLFKTRLRFADRYRFKVTSQHHARIKDELAESYAKGGRRLFVFSEDGLWLVVDYSYGEPELETVNGDTADRDMDDVWKNFLNDLRREPCTLGDLRNFIFVNSKHINEFGEHLATHVKVMRKIDGFLRKLNKRIK